MANSGFVSCGLDEWKQRCPNGLKVTMDCVVRPGWDGGLNTDGQPMPRPRCALPDIYQSYSSFGHEMLTPVAAWDDANQIAQTGDDTGAPYLTLFCNDNSWCVIFVNADSTTTTIPLGNPNFDRTNNVFQLDSLSPLPGQPNCIYRFTFTCA